MKMKQTTISALILSGLLCSGSAMAGALEKKNTPFKANITNQQFYDSCQEAVVLYNKKDSTYALTSCISEIRAFLATLYVLQGETRGQISPDKLFCKSSFLIKNQHSQILSI